MCICPARARAVLLRVVAHSLPPSLPPAAPRHPHLSRLPTIFLAPRSPSLRPQVNLGAKNDLDARWVWPLDLRRRLRLLRKWAIIAPTDSHRAECTGAHAYTPAGRANRAHAPVLSCHVLAGLLARTSHARARTYTHPPSVADDRSAWRTRLRLRGSATAPLQHRTGAADRPRRRAAPGFAPLCHSPRQPGEATLQAQPPGEGQSVRATRARQRPPRARTPAAGTAPCPCASSASQRASAVPAPRPALERVCLRGSFVCLNHKPRPTRAAGPRIVPFQTARLALVASNHRHLRRPRAATGGVWCEPGLRSKLQLTRPKVRAAALFSAPCNLAGSVKR